MNVATFALTAGIVPFWVAAGIVAARRREWLLLVGLAAAAYRSITSAVLYAGGTLAAPFEPAAYAAGIIAAGVLSGSLIDLLRRTGAGTP